MPQPMLLEAMLARYLWGIIVERGQSCIELARKTKKERESRWQFNLKPKSSIGLPEEIEIQLN